VRPCIQTIFGQSGSATRGVIVRRLLVLTREQLLQESVVADAIQVMETSIARASRSSMRFREELETVAYVSALRR